LSSMPAEDGPRPRAGCSASATAIGGLFVITSPRAPAAGAARPRAWSCRESSRITCRAKQRARRARDRGLRVGGLLAPHAYACAPTAGGSAPPCTLPKQPGLRELAQVAPHRVRRHVE
jgi:hypothetical protein